MTRIPLILALPVALLAACGTPQERCIYRASGELRTFDKLIAETDATLKRGYGLKREPYTFSYYQTCQKGTTAEGAPILGQCLETETRYRNVPVAVDLDEERRKLAGLKERRSQESKRVAAATKQCKAEFPE